MAESHTKTIPVFNPGDIIVSIQQHTHAQVMSYDGNGIYNVVIAENDSFVCRKIYSDYWMLKTSPLCLQSGDRFRHNTTGKTGTIIGVAKDFGLRYGDLMRKGCSEYPEPLYFVTMDDINARVDYLTKNPSTCPEKIVNASQITKINVDTGIIQ